MSFIKQVKKNWEISISNADLFLDNPTKEELLNLITSAIPKKEITSQLVRLAVHLTKISIYGYTTPSWKITIRDALLEIRDANTRDRRAGTYYTLDDMHQMFLTRWNSILSWVANESEGKWTVPKLKKKVTANAIWNEITKLPVAKMIDLVKPSHK